MKNIMQAALTSALVFSAFFLSAQPPPPPPPGSTSGPIDSGVVALLVVTAVYGYYRLKQTDKANA